MKPYVSDKIWGVIRIVHTWSNRFESQMIPRMRAIQVLNLVDIRVDLIELKEVVRILSERVDTKPPTPPPMPLLETLIVDVNSLIRYFYTQTLVPDTTTTWWWDIVWSLKRKRVMRQRKKGEGDMI